MGDFTFPALTTSSLKPTVIIISTKSSKKASTRRSTRRITRKPAKHSKFSVICQKLQKFPLLNALAKWKGFCSSYRNFDENLENSNIPNK